MSLPYVKTISLFLFVSLCLASCMTMPRGTYFDQTTTSVPDYSLEKNWAALPTKEDNADLIPEGLKDMQSTAKADVFFVYPTLYFGDKDYDRWNAPLDLQKHNEEVDDLAVKLQASAFNGAGRVFVPRYRQAHINAYTHKDSLSAKKAFELAYQDVKESFAYYMSHYNNGRPIIIASHSQGTTHTSRLLEEFFDGKPLQLRLVAAYLIGIPVDLDRYESLKPCETANDVGCLVGWRTYKKDFKPKKLEKEVNYRILNTNPLSWTTDTEWVPAAANPGTVLRDFEGEPIEGLVGAQIHKSILWTNKPKFKGSWLLTTKNYHRGDINLYYVSIRENAQNRVDIFVGNK